MSENEPARVLTQLVNVIARELEAQAGVQRDLADMPPLIADSLLDFFEIRPKPGVKFPE